MNKIYAAVISLSCAACSPSLEQAPPGDYDLAALTVTHRPEQAEVGDSIVFTYARTNKGRDTIPAGTFRVDFYVDGERVSFDHATREMAPGAQSAMSMGEGYHHFKTDEPGTYSYRFVLDKENNLAETDETNNVIAGTFTVGPRSEERRSADALNAALRPRLQAIGEAVARGETHDNLLMAPNASIEHIDWLHLLDEDIDVSVRFGDIPNSTPPEASAAATHRLEFAFGWGRGETTLTAFLRYDEATDAFYLLPRTSQRYNNRAGGWLGIHMEQSAPPAIPGILVKSVHPGSPAEKTDLQIGDLIVAIDDVNTLSLQQFSFMIRSQVPGSKLILALERDGEKLNREVELSARPDPSVANKKMTNKAAPAFAVTLLESGLTHRLEDYRGKVLLLEFWATWCGPCIQAIPALNNVRAKFSADEVAILAISDETRDKVMQFQPKDQMEYTVALSTTAKRDYQVHAIPTAFLIDPQGIVRWTHVGYGGDRAEGVLARQIEMLLAERQASL